MYCVTSKNLYLNLKFWQSSYNCLDMKHLLSVATLFVIVLYVAGVATTFWYHALATSMLPKEALTKTLILMMWPAKISIVVTALWVITMVITTYWPKKRRIKAPNEL